MYSFTSFNAYPSDSGGSRARAAGDVFNAFDAFDAFDALDGNADDEDQGKLVIVIDDSHLICRIVEYSLGHYGIHTVPFYSGIDAINALYDGTVPIPDLVLLDITMPDMNGYDVANFLNENHAFRSVPVVMLSGHDGLINRIRAKRVGAEDFIRKPFKKPDLIRKIFPLLDLDVPEDMSGPRD